MNARRSIIGDSALARCREGSSVMLDGRLRITRGEPRTTQGEHDQSEYRSDFSVLAPQRRWSQSRSSDSMQNSHCDAGPRTTVSSRGRKDCTATATARATLCSEETCAGASATGRGHFCYTPSLFSDDSFASPPMGSGERDGTAARRRTRTPKTHDASPRDAVESGRSWSQCWQQCWQQCEPQCEPQYE